MFDDIQESVDRKSVVEVTRFTRANAFMISNRNSFHLVQKFQFHFECAAAVTLTIPIKRVHNFVEFIIMTNEIMANTERQHTQREMDFI